MKKVVLLAGSLICSGLFGCTAIPTSAIPAIGAAVTSAVEDATESQESKDKKFAQLFGRYQADDGVVSVLRGALAGKSVSVGDFDSFEPGLKQLNCRVGIQIRPPNRVPFSAFLRDAMIEDIKSAGGYSPESPVVLTGKLNSIDFSSYGGHWLMSLTITSSNGKSLTVADKYEFKTSFGGMAACNDVKDALMPAVHRLLAKVASDPAFASLL